MWSGETTQIRPSNVDDARAGAGAAAEAEVVPLVVERKYTSRRLCMSASVLGAGVHGIGKGGRKCARAFGVSSVSSVSSVGVVGVSGVGGPEGSRDAPEKVRRPSEGSNMVTNVSAV